MSKFKVGDKVIFKDNNAVVTIIEIDEFCPDHLPYLVKGVDEYNVCWRSEESLTLVKETAFNIGDTVENSKGFRGYVRGIPLGDGTYRIEVPYGHENKTEYWHKDDVKLIRAFVSQEQSQPVVNTDHYNNNTDVFDFIAAQGLSFAEGNIVKYICRHRKKNGLVDLSKAKHYLELLMKEQFNKDLETAPVVDERTGI